MGVFRKRRWKKTDFTIQRDGQPRETDIKGITDPFVSVSSDLVAMAESPNRRPRGFAWATSAFHFRLAILSD